ncbi:energy transducer TonB [bacterium]|nr:energy transducer TonB [candidate division CSSED10-310 bacterium]
MTYDQIQQKKRELAYHDRIVMDWMVILAIIFHLFILYLIIPDFKSTRKWQETQNTFIQMTRYKPPPPPKEEKVEEKVKQKKKKVLAKPIPEPEIDDSEPVIIDDTDVELVFDADDIEFDAPEPPPEGPLRVGGDVKAPTLLKRIDPVYPDIARRTRIQGMVILEAIITKEGRVQDVKVVKSLNSFCDQAAIEAVMQWMFEPGTQNDIPVDVIMNLTVIFKLN